MAKERDYYQEYMDKRREAGDSLRKAFDAMLSATGDYPVAHRWWREQYDKMDNELLNEYRSKTTKEYKSQ